MKSEYLKEEALRNCGLSIEEARHTISMLVNNSYLSINSIISFSEAMAKINNPFYIINKKETKKRLKKLIKSKKHEQRN